MRMRWARRVARMGIFIQNFSRKPEGKRPLGRRRYRWENNAKVGHLEIGC
jgi:hypothetical protein